MTIEMTFDAVELLGGFLTEQKGFQSYNLRAGLGEFETKVLDVHGSSTHEEMKYHIFEWRTESGKDVSVDIAIVYDEDDDKYEYVVNI